MQYHLFTAAVCLGTLVLNHPQNVLAEFALGQIDVATACYAALLRTTSSRTLLQNHEWLVRLRARCSTRMAQSAEKSGQPHTHTNTSNSREDTDGDVELLGWRTRLIERANKGGQRATTIPAHGPNASPMSIDGLLGSGAARLPTAQQVMQQHYMPGTLTGGQMYPQPDASGSTNPANLDHSTDMLVSHMRSPYRYLRNDCSLCIATRVLGSSLGVGRQYSES